MLTLYWINHLHGQQLSQRLSFFSSTYLFFFNAIDVLVAVEYIQRQYGMLSEATAATNHNTTTSSHNQNRRSSDTSLVSTVSGLADNQALATGTACE